MYQCLREDITLACINLLVLRILSRNYCCQTPLTGGPLPLVVTHRPTEILLFFIPVLCTLLEGGGVAAE